MRMTDVLVQMACGTSWNLPAAGSSSGRDAVSDNSFQSLLEKQQSQLKDPVSQDSSQSSGTSQDESLSFSPSDQKAQRPVVTMDLMAMGAALLAEGLPQMQTPELPAADLSMVSVNPVGMEVVSAEAVPLAEGAEVSPLPLAGQTVPTQVQPQQELSLPQEAVQTALPQAVSAPAEDAGAGSLEDTFSAPSSQKQESVEVTDLSGAMDKPLFQVTEHVPLKVGEAVTVDTTAPAGEMDAALSKALTGALEDGSQRLEIKLSPASLGTVTAEFIRNPDGVLHVVLRAENEQAIKILTDHASTLGLLLQDTTRGEVRVEIPQPQQGQQLWQQPDQGGQQQQQQQQQQQHAPKQETESFLHQLRLGLLQTAPQAL